MKPPNPRDIEDSRARLSSIVGGLRTCRACQLEDIACSFRDGLCEWCQPKAGERSAEPLRIVKGKK